MSGQDAAGRVAGQFPDQAIVVSAQGVVVDQAHLVARIDQRAAEKDEAQRHLVDVAVAVRDESTPWAEQHDVHDAVRGLGPRRRL